VHIGLHDLLEGVLGVGDQRLDGARDADVVDERTDATELFGDRMDDRLHLNAR
jgi:hypothetical protein